MISLIQQGRPKCECSVVFGIFVGKCTVPYLDIIHITPILYIKFPTSTGTNRRAELKRMRNSDNAADGFHLIYFFVDIIGHGVTPVDKAFCTQHEHMPEIRRPFNTLNCRQNAVVKLVIAADCIMVGQRNNGKVVVGGSLQKLFSCEFSVAVHRMTVKLAG